MEFEYLIAMPLEERIEEINRLRREIAKHSPFSREPVDCVEWVRSESVSE